MGVGLVSRILLIVSEECREILKCSRFAKENGIDCFRRMQRNTSW